MDGSEIEIAEKSILWLRFRVRGKQCHASTPQKGINAFEAGAELTPEVVANYPIEHARCGTAFLLTLVLLSILVFTLLGPMPMFWRLATRILFIPILAGIALEYTRWTANHLDSPFVQLLIKPNLALQHLTTRTPDLSMLEVAIASFQSMRKAEQEVVVT